MDQADPTSKRDASIVRERLLTANYDRLPLLLVPTPLVGAITAWPLSSAVPPRRILYWIVVLTLLALLGLGARVLFRRRRAGGSLLPWIWVRLATAAFNGLGWGLYPVLFMWVGDRFDLQLFFVILVSLTTAVSMANAGVFYPAMAVYSICCVVPLAMRMALEGGALHVTVAAELLGLLVIVLAGGYATARVVEQQQRLMLANERMVLDVRAADERLTEANRTLNNRVQERTQELALANEEKLRSELSLARAQKVEAIGRLAGGVAHDFNNVLTGILGSASFLADSLAQASPEQREEVEEIMNGAKRAGRLTAQLLSLTRGGFGRPSHIDASERLKHLAHLLKRALGERYRLEIVPDEGPGSLFMDPTEFDQLVMNLVLNARDAAKPGQSIWVTLERRDLESGRPGGVRPQNLVLRVTDQGEGIASDVIDRIFEPFFSTKGEGGTGLGLATSLGIVQRAGGTIEVQSKVGVGTTFTVTLPLSENAPTSDSPGKPSGLARAVARAKEVLLVEDQEPVLRVIVRALTMMGAHVHEARSGEEALTLFQSGLPSLDLLLTDVLLPKMTGPDLVRELRASGYQGPCLLMSGYIDDVTLEDHASGVRLPLIRKPFSAAELSAAIEKILGPGVS